MLKPTVANHRFMLCYPGTLNSHQGIHVAVRAIKLLENRLPNLGFLIVGDGPDRERLNSLIRDNGLQDRVSVMGTVPIEKVAEIMASVDLGIVPKLKDSFGNEAFSTKIMEFMAMGVPVVVSKTKIDEYYFTERIVQFFDSNNDNDLANKISELCSDVERRQELAANAWSFIQANNWDVKKNEYFELVDQLVRRSIPREHSSEASEARLR